MSAYLTAKFSYSSNTFGISSSLNAYGFDSSPTTGSTEVSANPSFAKCITSSEKSKFSLVNVPLI